MSEWHYVKTNVNYLIRKIRLDLLPYEVIEINGEPVKSKQQALDVLDDCLKRGITAI